MVPPPAAPNLKSSEEYLTTGTALYKVGLGEDITKAEQPGTFDLKVRFQPLLTLGL